MNKVKKFFSANIREISLVIVMVAIAIFVQIRSGGSFLTGETVFAPIKEADKILEVKYDEFLPGFIARLLEFGNMNQTAYSKYRLGREQIQEV